MNDTLQRIKKSGYWQVSIRPMEFQEDRIENLAMCTEIVRENAVLLRGWDYPHFDPHNLPTSGINYVEQTTDWQDKLEFWRMYQSAQFVHYFAMWEDWQEERTLWGVRENFKPGQILSIIGAVYTFTEIFEFAARIATKGYLGKESMVSISLHLTKGRQLVMLDPRRLSFAKYESTLEKISHDITVPTETLMAKSAELAREQIAWFFERFNWHNVSKEMFQEDQRKLIERRL